MDKSKYGYLVKIIDTCGNRRILNKAPELNISLVNKFGIITYIYKFLDYTAYNISIKRGKTIIIYEDEVEILNNEPASNIFHQFCFWCNNQNRYIDFKKQRIFYCPKCLR